MQAFEWFGGVFPEIRFDNLKSAVKKVLKGRRRIESDRFVALRSHYLFASQFMTPGLEGAHQKGGVEGEVGRYRRNHLVPVPQLRDLAELNAMLLAGCEADLGRRIDGRSVTVGQAWAVERPLLLTLPAEPFDACETVLVGIAGADGGGGATAAPGQDEDRLLQGQQSSGDRAHLLYLPRVRLPATGGDQRQDRGAFHRVLAGDQPRGAQGREATGSANCGSTGAQTCRWTIWRNG